MTHIPIFKIERSLVDVTSLHRPDTRWSFIDTAGHEHRWYDGEIPAQRYSAIRRYTLPTLTRIHDGWEYDEDDERRELWHMACWLCKEEVKPGYCADETTQYVPGLVQFYIDDKRVSKEEFERRRREVS